MKKSILRVLKNGIVCIFLCSSAIALCDTYNAEKHQSVSKKVYISLDQLWMDENGIFVNLNGDVQPISGVFRDEAGFYVDADDLVKDAQGQYQCPNGHPSRHGDGRCNQKACPYFRGK